MNLSLVLLKIISLQFPLKKLSIIVELSELFELKKSVIFVGKYCLFFLMNKILSKFSGSILERFACDMYPASENFLSHGTLVAGVHNIALTALNKYGYSSSHNGYRVFVSLSSNVVNTLLLKSSA